MSWRNGFPATRIARWPTYAVAIFVALYAVAACLYPGGTRANPTRIGFSFADNYWCDLLDAATYDGRPNRARPVALTATIVLSFGLSALWWTVPAVYPHARRRAVLVRSAGIASALVTPFIATAKHDLAVRLACLFGFVAFLITMTASRFSPRDPLLWITRSTFLACLLNYIVWEAGIGPRVLPLIQKAAFAAFLLWIVLLARRTEELSHPARRT